MIKPEKTERVQRMNPCRNPHSKHIIYNPCKERAFGRKREGITTVPLRAEVELIIAPLYSSRHAMSNKKGSL